MKTRSTIGHWIFSATKHNTWRKLSQLIIGSFLLWAGTAVAQKDFRPGYVVTNEGDSLYGQIDYRGDFVMGMVCKFKGPGNVVTEYAPTDIQEYRFIDSKCYVSKEVDGKAVFLEYLIRGEVSIYYLRDDTGDHYYLSKEDVPLTHIPYEEGIKHIDNKKVFYTSKQHIGLLSYYMQDAAEFQPKIQSIKKPTHQTLIKLAEDYHNAVCEEEKCIIYEKRLPFVKVIPEVVVGAVRYLDQNVRYSNLSGVNDRSYPQLGVIGHIWLPRNNEKIYLRTGILFSLFGENEGGAFRYKIPLSLEYIYPKGRVRPRVAYGVNFYSLDEQLTSVNLGGNVTITDRISVSITSDIEFHPFQFVLLAPNRLAGYSGYMGLFIHLW